MARQKWDWLLFCLIGGVGLISLLAIYSIDKSLAASQLKFWIIGLLVLVLVSFSDYHLWRRYSLVFYLGIIGALLLLLLIAEPIRGSVRWLEIGGFRFQPSEIAKVAIILLMANFYSNKSAAQLRNLVGSFLLVLPSVILIFAEPDIGNALILVGVWLGITFMSGLSLKQMVATAILVILFAFSFYQIAAPYQKQRIASFINPAADPLGTGYSIIQAKIAVGSGQLIGRGLGRGSQSQLKFLPESESDFIFASIAEQLGFLGAGLLIILYIFIIGRILSFTQNRERFSQLALLGAAFYLFWQFLINVGMNIGLIPVTGITLPLVSYGGSSLVTTLFLLGLVLAIKRQPAES